MTVSMYARDPEELAELVVTLTAAQVAELLKLGLAQVEPRNRPSRVSVCRFATVARLLIAMRAGELPRTLVAHIARVAASLGKRQRVQRDSRVELLRLIALCMRHTPDLEPTVLVGIAEQLRPDDRSDALSRTATGLLRGRSAIGRAATLYGGPFARQRRTRLRDVMADLDLSAAARHVHVDMKGDWYKDPWQWAEVRWLAEHGSALVSARLLSGVPSRAVPLDVPKASKGVRPAMVMGAVDRLAYQATVDSVAPGLLSGLPDWVYGWRRARDGSDFAYADNGDEWHRLLSERHSHRAEHRYMLALDVRSFFENVSVNRLAPILYQALPGQEQVAEVIVSQLVAFETLSRRRGLPQRFLASSVLAQRMMEPVDSFLTRCVARRGVKALRWMDDIEVYGDHPHTLEEIADGVAAALASVGLFLNVAKTRLVPTSLLGGVGLDTYGIDHRLRGQTGNESEAALERLAHDVTKNADRISRSDVSFLAARIRRKKAYGVLSVLEHHLGELTHAADALSRAFRDSGRWVERTAWYGEFLEMHPVQTDWSTHAWSIMFPTDAAVSNNTKSLVDSYAQRIEAGRLAYALLPGAFEQLRVWSPGNVVDLCQVQAESSVFPLEFRAIALAAAAVIGAAAPEVKRWLSSDSDSYVTRRMLEHFGTVPARSSDFLPVEHSQNQSA